MDSEIYKIIETYKRNLESMGISVTRMVLFGSHASGTAQEHSDIDLAIVSNHFKNLGLLERLGLLGRARVSPQKIRKPMEILGFTEEEFDAKGKGSFVGDEVKAKGRVVQF